MLNVYINFSKNKSKVMQPIFHRTVGVGGGKLLGAHLLTTVLHDCHWGTEHSTKDRHAHAHTRRTINLVQAAHGAEQ